METKKYLYVVGSSYLVPIMLTLIVLVGHFYCLATDWQRIFSVNSMQMSMLLITAILLVSLLPESNLIMCGSRNIYLYSISESRIENFSEEGLVAILQKRRGAFGRDAIGRFSTSPRSPLLRCVFLMLIALSVVFETVVGIKIFTAGVKCADALLLGCLLLLCVLDLCFIVNRCVDRAGLRFLWCAFGRERLAGVETEVGGEADRCKASKGLVVVRNLVVFCVCLCNLLVRGEAWNDYDGDCHNCWCYTYQLGGKLYFLPGR